MRRLYKLTLKREFFITGLLSAISISLVFIFLFSIHLYQTGVSDAEQKISTSNLIISTNIDNVFRNVANTVDVLTTDPSVIHYAEATPSEQKRVRNLYQSLTDSNPFIKYCFSGYDDGTIVINNYALPEGYNAVQRPWYTSAFDKYPDMSIGLPFQDVANNEWLISVSKVIVDEEGNKVGVVAIGCAFDPIIDLMNSNKYYPSQANFIVSEDNYVILHQNSSLIGLHIDQISKDSSMLLNRQEGFVKYPLADGMRNAYYKKSGLAHWTLISAIDSSEITTPIVIRVVFVILILIVVSLLLGLVQVTIFERRFVEPLSKMRQRISNIMQGEAVEDEPVSFTNDELESIVKNIELIAKSTLTHKVQELNLILESTSDSILVLGKNAEVIHYNTQFVKLWNLDQNQTYAHESDFPIDAMKRQVVKIHGGCFEFKQELDHREDMICNIELKNGLHFEVLSKPLLENNEIAGRLWSYRDVTEKKKDQERLTHLATTDDLTGLWNRRYFLERLEMEIEIARRFRINLAVIQMDIDFFKRVNDTFGHAAGDQGLAFVANVLRKQLRESDVIGRIGGEEFCIMIQNSDPNQVYFICEKIRNYFEQNFFNFEDKTINFTVSMGIAYLDEAIDSLPKLLRAADEACYKAKAAGRNRIMPELIEEELV